MYYIIYHCVYIYKCMPRLCQVAFAFAEACCARHLRPDHAFFCLTNLGETDVSCYKQAVVIQRTKKL